MTAWLIVIEIEPERSQQVRKHHATKRAPPGYCSLSPDCSRRQLQAAAKGPVSTSWHREDHYN